MADGVAIVPMTVAHAARVLEIYGEGIATGDATLESVVPDWETFDAGHVPGARLVALVDREVAGWVALSPYSARSVYRGVAWESVYVGAAFRTRGIGRALLEAVIPASEAAGFWTLLAGIEVENTASLDLHARAGFRRLGTHERLGRDPAGRWRDVVILERRTTDP
ncbi:MAG: phosphinothricin acetyltransferase [Chloroflexi bacterium RBG_16_70_13]|nr:MAG: phosphinothricin acetyltransferase [Chloroflexi bacterium RBG_16_70_13]